MDDFQIGIDLGGTKIETILFDPQGKVCHRKRVPTPRGGVREYENIREAVYHLIRDTLDRVPDPKNTAVGIGIPGIIDTRTQLVVNANTTCLIGKPFKADLEKMLKRAVGMENDADCFTLAECLGGAAKGHRFVFGIILGTGCGGGLCIDGKIHHGRHNIAGEWGHFSVDPAGEKCYCGNRGCIETKISGTGVANAHFQQYEEKLNIQQIVERFQQGDEKCRRTFEQFLDDFGRCVGGLISILDPDAVVIGGGVSNIDALYSEGVDRIRRYAFHKNIETPILKNQLGDSAGVYGAAWIGDK